VLHKTTLIIFLSAVNELNIKYSPHRRLPNGKINISIDMGLLRLPLIPMPNVINRNGVIININARPDRNLKIFI